MSFDHNLLAHKAARLLLSQLQSRKAVWAPSRLTEKATYWHGMADWPRPDFAFEDRSTGASLAIEFKPPGQPKREYVTGLGQVLTYLRSFEFTAMIVPRFANDGFEISQYLRDNLNESFAMGLPIGLFVYEKDPSNQSDLSVLIKLHPRKGSSPPIPKGIGRKIFWGYWRDLSQHDVLSILIEMDSRNPHTFNSAFSIFWKKQMTKGRALTWEGKPRKARQLNASSYKAERLNALLSIRHIGIINSEGKLTEDGYQLLHCGKVYGAGGMAFLSLLGRQILEIGRHLELIFWVEEQQRNIPRKFKHSAKRFYQELDIRLQDEGIIPSVPQGGGKETFLRDEQKLWNKLGLLVPSKGKSYFHPDVGLVFNYRAIISMTG